MIYRNDDSHLILKNLNNNNKFLILSAGGHKDKTILHCNKEQLYIVTKAHHHITLLHYF